MKDIFNLFKHIKYVFLVDFSCSNTVHNNDLKQFAQNTEGNSITQEIQNYNNLSPYNILNENEQEVQYTRLKLLENAARTRAIEKVEVNFNKGFTLIEIIVVMGIFAITILFSIFLGVDSFKSYNFKFQAHSNLHQRFLKLMMNYKFEELLVKKLKKEP
jgi:prepilin-type N-terminal cleavage/methylation domain-containing protein